MQIIRMEGGKQMKNWITIGEGEYSVESAYLLAPEYYATPLENTIIHVFSGRDGHLSMEGKSLVENIHIVELLEHGDTLDLLLVFDAEIIFLMKNPILHGGKVFAANVKSTIRFSPRTPWKKIEKETYIELKSKLKLTS